MELRQGDGQAPRLMARFSVGGCLWHYGSPSPWWCAWRAGRYFHVATGRTAPGPGRAPRTHRGPSGDVSRRPGRRDRDDEQWFKRANSKAPEKGGASCRCENLGARAWRQATATHGASGSSASPPWERLLATLHYGWNALAPVHEPYPGARQPQRQQELPEQRERWHRFRIRVGIRVRPPLAGTHQCHRATSAGSGMMLTVKLTKSSSIDP